uniref:Uncharacterized protein n=1 Tax=Arundo donax TaxID=35708 RepID=A0A0A8Z4P1_ARUDO
MNMKLELVDQIRQNMGKTRNTNCCSQQPVKI